MHIYEYIQHPCTTLHLTGRAPKLAVMPGDVSAARGVGTPGKPAEAPGPAGA
jgi:hypothetical protein